MTEQKLWEVTMELKINYNDPKTGKSYKKDIKDDDVKAFLGKQLNQTIKGELLDMPGYEFLITGGSDRSGFPMRRDVQGSERKKVLINEGVGIKPTRKGMRRRKSVSGNTIGENTVQLNLKITKYGKDPLEKPAEAKEEAPKEEKS